MNTRWTHISLAAAFVLTAGQLIGCEGEESSPDGEFDEGVSAGKADGTTFSACELSEVLNLVNDPATDADTLRSGGVHTRGARNIINYRDNDDDNATFDSIEELDDVSWVGPAAFRQLVAMVTDLCQGGQTGDADVIFSPQEYEDSHLARVADEIALANDSLDIAMYSFSDAGIFNAIEDALARGVSVRMIFESANGDHNDPEGSQSARLEAIGVDVRYINKIMHHKYVIIDGPRTSALDAQTSMLITGSGNWSNSAGTRYDENTAFVRGNAELVLLFQREFNYLWANSRDLIWNEDLEFFESLEIVDQMIIDDPGVDAVFTSANFDTYISSRYGPTFSVVRGRNEVSDRLVELIWSAQSSIRIASGHLRSRPVSEALMARHEADPELDIRVYLDNQEYLSQSTHEGQLDDLDDCLEEAGDSEAQRQDCMDKGFLFSYELHTSGIDVRYKYYCYRWHYSYAAQMHNKYMIIDDNIVASGSYNLSDNAEHNTMENVVIYRAPAFSGVVDSFIENFESIWVTGQADNLYDDLMDDVTDGSGGVPIVFDSMSLTWPEVRALKSAILAACPNVNSYEYRTNSQAHRTCY